MSEYVFAYAEYESEAVRQKRARIGPAPGGTSLPFFTSSVRVRMGVGTTPRRLRTEAHRTPGGRSMRHEATTMAVVQDPVEAPKSLWEHLDDAD